MGRRISTELHYDATPEQVRAMMLDAGFREQVGTEQHVARQEVVVDGDTVTVEQVQVARGIPSFAAKFVGDEITIRQTEEWADHSARVHLTIPGKPGEMSGTTTLRASGSGTAVLVDWEVRVQLPLVGGKVEGLIVDLMLKALSVEQETGRAWLAD